MGKGKKINVKDEVYPVTTAQLNSFLNAVDQIIGTDFSPGSLQEVASRVSISQEPFLRLCARALRKADLNQQKAIVLLVSKVDDEEAGAFLKSLLERKDIEIEVKGMVLSILKDKGSTIPAGVELAVSQASSWLSRAFSAFLTDDEKVSDLGQELDSFPRELKWELVQRAADEGERALPFFKKLFGASPQVDELIAQSLSRIPCQAAVSFLGDIISAAADKRVEKAARKSLFLLKGRGLPVEAGAKKGVVPFGIAREKEDNRAFVSGIDYLGYRLVWLVKAQPGRGIIILRAVLSDSKGITDFHLHETTRKEFREYRDKIVTEKQWLVAEVEYPYSCYLLEEAYATNLANGIDPPREYLNWRAKLKPSLKEETGPLINKLLGVGKAGEEDFPLGIQSKAGQIPELASWRLEPGLVEKYARKVAEIKESRLLVTPEQKRAAVEEIYEKAARELFDEGRRKLYKRKLEEMAALFFLKKREEDARVALAVSLSLEKESPLLPVNPFALELTKKGISLVLKEEPTTTRTLVTP